MFYTYILISEKDKKTYTGYTSNLEERLKYHNSGMVKATKNRRPFKIFYKEEFLTEQEAKERERYFKSSVGRRKLKKIFGEHGKRA
ncbi:MAG: GIY-YIG nuclease family protein [Patescibacteria group bacterium]